jgi:putative transposase
MNKSQLARTLGIARSSLSLHLKRPKQDKALAVRMEAAQEKDDPMGHRKLAALLGTGKHRIRRVMHNYGLAARRKRKKSISPGKATEIAPNKLREDAFEWVKQEVIFSDILEVKLADGTRVRGCFAALAPHAPGVGHRVRLSYASRPGHRRHPDDDL